MVDNTNPQTATNTGAANTNSPSILGTIGAGISAVAGLVGLGVSTVYDQTALKQAITDAQAKRALYNSPQTLSLLPEESSSYYTSIAIGAYQRNDIKSVIRTNVGEGYKLPIPMRLTDSNAVEWGAEKLGLVGSAQAGEIIQAIQSVAVKNAGTLGQLYQVNQGVAPNEFLTLMFKSPTYKKFSLSFKLSPNTPAMSSKVHQMIRNFKNAQAPTDMGAIFKYPNLFFIKFHGSDYLFDFKPAVLESFIVDYAAAGVPAFYRGTGAPESYNITMNFQEIEFWMAGDFK